MTELVITADDFKNLDDVLLEGSVEHVAVILAQEVPGRDEGIRLLAREIIFPTDDNYARQSSFEAELRPEFVAGISKRARLSGCAIVWVHSHCGLADPEFSGVDDEGERHLAHFLSHRNPNHSHAALLISKAGVRARELGSSREIRVVSLGRERLVRFPNPIPSEIHGEFDRQVRAFGRAGQEQLATLKIAVVGVGGTGSIVVEQLAHLGIKYFRLLDPDVVELTNLNRVAGSKPSDVGRPKVEVAEDLIRSIVPDARVQTVRGDVTRSSTLKELLDCDFIFGCTDSHGSRSAVQQVVYQYLIPCVDVGTTIVVRDGGVQSVSGRVQLLSPGIACFTCGSLLDPDQVRQDMMTAFERSEDPYIVGIHEPAPAVMALNGIVASVGVSMMLSVVTGFPMNGRHLIYDGIRPALRSVSVTQDPSCYICSHSGTLARGASWPLFVRNDSTVAN